MQSITDKLGAPPVLPYAKSPPSIRELSLNITVSTPMAGGGVEAGKVDERRPIRVPSVKGHLRYWWRMMHPDSPEKESDIWGSTEKPGKVYVSIPEQPSVSLRYCDNSFEFDKYGPENYALFSSLPTRDKPGNNIARENFSFTLKLTYPQEYHDDVRLALSAWIYFGGIGSRTRRGCGSLSCDETPADLGEILRAAPNITLWRKEANNPLSAWSYAVKRYKDYRQTRNKGQGTRPGRSRWPEADSLRQITGRADHRHSIPITSPLPSFPRAALGMPIIFHFKDRDDPKDATVVPKAEGSSRMASPVITKALYDNGKWYSAVIILPHDDVFDVPLKLDGMSRAYNIPSRRGAIYRNTQPMLGQTDAISGFEEYISRDFTREAIR
ncbi:MAG: type III-B CRISPR module RAMP protein Cmr1 [Synergistaceae bacterium]|nr:type III-B CRISPR module RAMP protein Cmr1 [Synergistaceae bacterium]